MKLHTKHLKETIFKMYGPQQNKNQLRYQKNKSLKKKNSILKMCNFIEIMLFVEQQMQANKCFVLSNKKHYRVATL